MKAVTMKMILNKILCACFGHKHVQGKDLPFTSMFSLITDGHYYVWDSILCDRCVMYHVYKKYPAAEWEKVVEARSSKFLDNLEKIIKILVIYQLQMMRF